MITVDFEGGGCNETQLGIVKYYCHSLFRWNQLDVGIVVLSIVGIALEEIKSKFIPINPTIIRVMRVMRIARGKMEYKPFVSLIVKDVIQINELIRLILMPFGHVQHMNIIMF